MDWLRKLLGLHIHDWTKWSETGEIRIHQSDGHARIVGKSQERVCQSCGFKQYHKQYVI